MKIEMLTIGDCEVEAVPYDDEDFLIKGTAQDRLTLCLLMLNYQMVDGMGVEHTPGYDGRYSDNRTTVKLALDYFWPGWDERVS